MNFIRPTTSAEDVRSAAIIAALALVSVGVIGVSLRDAAGGIARAEGIALAAEAASGEISATRDAQLDRAQAQLTEALAMRGDDAALWTALSNTRYLQATGAEVRTVSPALLAAAREAAERAVALAPQSADAQTRLALALSLTAGRTRDAADALMASYRIESFEAALAASRTEAAGRLWGLLDIPSRDAARVEACVARRAGEILPGVFADVATDPTCAFAEPEATDASAQSMAPATAVQPPPIPRARQAPVAPPAAAPPAPAEQAPPP